MRYDIETVLAGAVTALLGSLVPKDIACLPTETKTANCLIVDFTDPMSIDEANRIVALVPSAETGVEIGSEFTARIEVLVKSRWAKPTMAADYSAHNARVKSVRDKLMPVDLATRLDAKMPSGAKLDFASKRRSFSTRVYDNGWITSETAFTVNGHFTTEE